MPDRLRFGVFHGPYHLPIGRNPQLLLRRDVEFIQHLDRLGFDEVWVGEHHSCGAELIADPFMFLAHLAHQTENIALCTGVVSLPYHNPLWVADRIVLLDHLARGRAKIGLGPGVLTTDAHMIGLDPTTQREALEEDVDVLMRLLYDDEPVTITTDRYRLQEARIQMGLYSDIEIAVAGTASPVGPRIAGKHGLGLLSIGATMARQGAGGVDALAAMWSVFEARADKFGQTADRGKWRLVGPMHIAETREEAAEQASHGIDAWFDYLQNVQAATHFEVAGSSTEERIEWVRESGLGVIGTPDDAIAQIGDLIEQSNGGFGAYLLLSHEWANWENTLKSYQLLAEHVMGRYQGQIDRQIASEKWASSRRDELGAAQMRDVQQAIARHAAEQDPAGAIDR